MLTSPVVSFGRGFAIVAAALGVVTIVLGVICGVSVVRTQAFLAESLSASGEVIGLVSRQSCEERDGGERECTTVYAPRVRFQTADGREITFVSDTASSPPEHDEGDLVEVRYRADRPADARIDSVTGIWLGTIVTGILTAVFAAMCVIWIVLAVRFRAE